MDFDKVADEASQLATGSVQLDMWPDDRRGAPNSMLRSALFSAAKPRAKRRDFEDRPLPSLGRGSFVKHSGPELFQSDLDVWLHCVHLCRLRELGTQTDFPVRTFLRGLGRSRGKTDRELLLRTFKRLARTSIHVEWTFQGRKRGYVGPLVQSLAYDETTGRWKVSLDPQITTLFAPTEHTWLHAEARHALGRSYLAKWLHGFYSSHRKPHPLPVAELREISGSKGGHLRRFRQSLRTALDEVARVEAVGGRTFAWTIDSDDRVHVARDPKSLKRLPK